MRARTRTHARAHTCAHAHARTQHTNACTRTRTRTAHERTVAREGPEAGGDESLGGPQARIGKRLLLPVCGPSSCVVEGNPNTANGASALRNASHGRMDAETHAPRAGLIRGRRGCFQRRAATISCALRVFEYRRRLRKQTRTATGPAPRSPAGRSNSRPGWCERKEFGTGTSGHGMDNKRRHLACPFHASALRLGPTRPTGTRDRTHRTVQGMLCCVSAEQQWRIVSGGGGGGGGGRGAADRPPGAAKRRPGWATTRRSNAGTKRAGTRQPATPPPRHSCEKMHRGDVYSKPVGHVNRCADEQAPTCLEDPRACESLADAGQRHQRHRPALVISLRTEHHTRAQLVRGNGLQ